jgi:undecaprenyl diphosphate synthase
MQPTLTIPRRERSLGDDAAPTTGCDAAVSADPNPEARNPNPALPRHVAIIMDGNGRWARARGLSRSAGHTAGTEAVRAIVTRCAELKLAALTLYSFSTENWARSHEEVSHLMGLCVHYLAAERHLFMENGIRFRAIGRRAGLPDDVLEAIDETEAVTAGNAGMTLNIALNYGSRAEITDAVRAIAQRVARGELAPEAIEESHIDASLYTAGQPDPDLLIRTAGEMRLSNYLLWQLSYAELYVTDVCWPDFTPAELDKAFTEFTRRTRRFGAVVES